MSKYPGRIVTDLAPAGYSVFFDGTGDYLTVPSGASVSGNAAFTVEFWVYMPVANTNARIVSGAANQFTVSMSSDGTMGYGKNGVVDVITVSAGTSILGQWTHIAIGKSGANGTARIWRNGSSVGTATDSQTYTAGTVFIGSTSTPSNYLTGYIANLRITNTDVYGTSNTTINVPNQLFAISGTQLLTCNSPAFVDQSNNAFVITPNNDVRISAFTPFTAYVPYNPALGASTPGVWTLDEALQAKGTRQWNMYDPYFNQTALLLHGNSPTNVPTFITDSSANNFTITSVGDTRAANLSPFSLTSFPNSGSGYFDGTGDWLTLPSTNSLVFGTGDFCVEFWLNRTGTTGGIFSNSQSVGGGDTQFEIALNGSNRVILIGWNTTFMTGATTINTNIWYHIAVVRSGTSMAIFVNGTRDATTTSANNFSSTNAFLIGAQAGGSGRTIGYISNLRAVKGSFVYDPAQSTITVPTSPLTAIANTSLLTLQNSQSSNNNAFLDSSSNNFLVTRNGNTTQGSFSPFSQAPGYWSNYFNGSSQLVAPSTNGPIQFGTSAFTIEFWIYPASVSSRQAILSTTSGAGSGPVVALSATAGGFGVGIFGSADTINTGGNVINANQWQHIAVVRNSTATNDSFIYVDGNLRATGTLSTNFSTAYSVSIGQNGSGGEFFTGYISNLRVTKGVAVYTRQFTPISVPLTATVSGGTVSLLTCQSSRFVDNSSNAFALTVNGAPSVQPFSPFYATSAYTPQTLGGSGYFDGTTDYLTYTTPSTVVREWWVNDFTVEAWIYPTTLTGWDYLDGANRISTVIGNASPTATNNFWSFGPINTGAVRLYYFNGAGVLVTSTETVRVNQWNHIAFTKTSTGIRIFVNGVGTTATAISGTPQSGNTFPLTVGQINNTACNGYISGVRILNGTAQYSGTTYTIPTAPPTAITNTSFLLNFTNAGIVDSTAKNVLETVGNAQISTTQSKFGGTSMYFDGNGDNLLTTPNQVFDLGASDFTIEFWLYPVSTSAGTLVYSTSNRVKTDALAILLSGGNVLGYATPSGGSVWTIMSAANFGSVTINTWSHVALVRNGSSFRGYVNGVQSASLATTSSAITSFNGFSIGSNGAAADFLNGYIDDLRITRFARYTANFTPQTSQWQDE